jgi:nucleoid-associated protein YgaU
VILPTDPLSPGTRELTLRAMLAGVETPGPDAVVVLVPQPGPTPPVATAEVPRSPSAPLIAQPSATAADSRMASAEAHSASGGPASGPVAMLLPQPDGGAAPRLLQGPSEPAAARPGQAPRLGLDAVDYDDAGAMRFTGTAPPGAAVRVYVGERHAGDAVADPEGRWSLTPRQAPPLGRNMLRLDQVAAAGMVAARIEVPFQRDHVPESVFRDGRVVVQPGHSLWHIARQAYGEGVRYTVIYQANRDQIRDPDRIYPGQLFTLPPEAGAASAGGQPTPPASSRSR